MTMSDAWTRLAAEHERAEAVRAHCLTLGCEDRCELWQQADAFELSVRFTHVDQLRNPRTHDYHPQIGATPAMDGPLPHEVSEWIASLHAVS